MDSKASSSYGNLEMEASSAGVMGGLKNHHQYVTLAMLHSMRWEEH